MAAWSPSSNALASIDRGSLLLPLPLSYRSCKGAMERLKEDLAQAIPPSALMKARAAYDTLHSKLVPVRSTHRSIDQLIKGRSTDWPTVPLGPKRPFCHARRAAAATSHSTRRPTPRRPAATTPIATLVRRRSAGSRQARWVRVPTHPPTPPLCPRHGGVRLWASVSAAMAIHPPTHPPTHQPTNQPIHPPTHTHTQSNRTTARVPRWCTTGGAAGATTPTPPAARVPRMKATIDGRRTDVWIGRSVRLGAGIVWVDWLVGWLVGRLVG